MSESYSVNTKDESLSALVLEFMKKPSDAGMEKTDGFHHSE